MQVHYSALSGVTAPDVTSVALHYATSAIRQELRILPLINQSFVIPAGAKDQVVTASVPIVPAASVPGVLLWPTARAPVMSITKSVLATTARRSNQLLALRNSYHGRSYAAMGVTGNRGWSASSLSPVNVSYVMNGYRYRSPFGHLSDADFPAGDANALMTPFVENNEVIREPGPVVLGMFADMGWRTPQPAGTRYTAIDPVRVLDTRSGSGRTPTVTGGSQWGSTTRSRDVSSSRSSTSMVSSCTADW